MVDDGIGITESQIGGRESLGLLGMQERAQLFSGVVNIQGVPGRGTTVSVSIPILPAAAMINAPVKL